jgi:hypothetical protein
MEKMDPWLARLRHDLVKRALWTARDLRDAQQAPSPSDVRALQAGLRKLIDAEGRHIDARALFALLLEDAPAAARGPACDAFAAALREADEAVAGAVQDHARAPAALQAVLLLEPAFEALARSMNPRI